MNSIVPRHMVSEFDGDRLVTVFLNGKPCWVATNVGRLMGYSKNGSKLTESINNRWGEEFIEGKDFDILTGEELKDLKSLIQLTPDSRVSRAPHVMVLYESGIYLATIKSGKPAGRKLRRWLVDEVLPSIQKGGTYTAETNTRHELDLMAHRRKLGMSFLASCKENGLIGDTFLNKYMEHSLAAIDGTSMVPSEGDILDVSGFLLGKGVAVRSINRMASQFGKRLKALYIKEYGKDPEMLPKLVNGATRLIFCYIEKDRRLFEETFNGMRLKLGV